MASQPPGPAEHGPLADPPRSLTDQLRSRSDAELAALLRARPDLGNPLPGDLTSLTARATARPSVQRALDHLDGAALQVVEVLAVLPEPARTDDVDRLWGADAGAVLGRLATLALVWGTPGELHLVRTVREVLGPQPAGLGPPLAEALGRRSPQRLQDLLEDLGLPPTPDPDSALVALAGRLGHPGRLAKLLATAPEGAQTVLSRLTWGPPVGRVAQPDRPLRAAQARGPVEWLLAHGVLAVGEPGHVVLPREIGLALRGGRVHRRPEPQPPEPQLRATRHRGAAATAVHAAAEAVRLVEQLGELWGAEPVPVLRSGGLGVRELRRLATRLELDDAGAARVVELAYAAGLVADDGEIEPRWAPTPDYDVWRAEGTGRRWARLAACWLETTRCPALVGSRDSRDSPRNALSSDLDRVGAPEVRHWLLATLAGLDAESGVPTPESLVERLRWFAPRRTGPARLALLEWAVAEAEWLGVTGAGVLSPAGRALLADPAEQADGEPDADAEQPPSGAGTSPAEREALRRRAAVERAERAAALLDAALPEPIDQVLIQADLTAVAPGPLVPELGRWLATAADVDSRGAGTVYRFSAASLRRALDAGWTAEDLLEILRRHSRTELPQPLVYLVQDTARSHGRLRVGAAGAYLRADDEGLLAEVLHDRRLGTLGLRRLAPTVLAAQASPEKVLEALRRAGHAPAAESPGGELLLRRPEEYRTPPRPLPRPTPRLPSPAPARARFAAVAALRAADRIRAARREVQLAERATVGEAPPLRAVDPAGLVGLLRDAVAGAEPVWIGYVDASGQGSARLVDPVNVAAGRLEAFDRAAGELRVFSVHRVTGIAAAHGAAPGGLPG